MNAFQRIAFAAAPGPAAQAAAERLRQLYGGHDPEQSDVIVALGGDGFLLQTLREHMQRRVPVYGMHQGSVGFLMNEYSEVDLRERLTHAALTTLYPLQMRATQEGGREHAALAINEVSLLRQTSQTAKLRITVDGRERVAELTCDGVLVSTPAGSTAYNFSAHGPILPLGANVLALTPISAFRPRRWRGALLPRTAKVVIEVLERDKRPVSATADGAEVRDVVRVEIAEAPELGFKLLFDPGHDLEERILAEQFAP